MRVTAPSIITTDDGFVFNLSTGTIIDYTGSATSLTIPNTISEVSVTGIGYEAFRDCDSLTSVTVPSGVTSIEDYAFYNCNNLTQLYADDIQLSIGDYALSNCDSLTGVFGSDIQVTSMGSYAFSNCDSLTIIYGDSVQITNIGDHAFYDCDNLRGIKAANLQVTSIGDYAFHLCENLQYAVIPDSVTSIGVDVFLDCHADFVIFGVSGSYAETYADANSIPFEPIDDDGNESFAEAMDLDNGLNGLYRLYLEDYDYYRFIPSISGEYEISSESPIDTYGYLYNSSQNLLTDDDDSGDAHNFKIAYNLTAGQTYYIKVKGYGDDEIGSYSLSITASITTDEGFIFDLSTGTITGYTGNATTLHIPSNINDVRVIGIGYEAFKDCDSLINVKLPLNIGTTGFVNSIEDFAFYNCSNLRSVMIPGGVISIGNNAFESCHEDFMIFGISGSYAQTYANNNSIPFEAINEDDGNEYFSDAKDVTTGLSRSHYMNSNADSDYYKFIPSVSGVYEMTSVSLMSIFGYLYDSDQVLITSDSFSGDDGNFKIVYELTAGQTYYIKLHNFDLITGPYCLRITASVSAQILHAHSERRLAGV